MRKRFITFVSLFLGLVLAAGALPETVQAKQGKKSSYPRRSSESLITGNNIYGRTGLLFSDTAEAPSQGMAGVTGHLLIGSGDDVDTIQLPLGVNYGLAENFEISAGIDYVSLKLDLPNVPGANLDKSRSGLNVLTLGGKYVIPRPGGAPFDMALGMDISHGPLTSEIGEDGTDIGLKGILSYTVMPQKVFLNGGLGLLFVDGRDVETRVVNPITGAVTTVKANGDSDTVLQVNGGLGYMLNPNLMGIAELGINQLGDDNSVLAFGVRGRASDTLTWQALLGLGLNDNPSDIILGGGLTHRFSLR